ncbi:MAG: T9SS type A sorting domain-containing protein, partial [Sphingobacteriales bacterium]
NYTTASCPGDADCGTFPGANQVIGVSTSAKVFYAKTATSMEQHGELSSGNITYANPMKVMQFPMTFNQTFTDAYSSSGNGGSKNGTITSTIDGYGTLKTPTGTYTNVLRQKVVDQATVVNAGGTMNMTITQYYWFVAGIHHHVMALLITEITGMPVQVPTSYVTTYTTKTNGGGNVGIDEAELLASKVFVFPNPASDRISVKANGLNIRSIDLYNVMGQKVLHKSIADQGITSTVELSDLQLSSGCYLLKMNTAEGQVSKQVVIR